MKAPSRLASAALTALVIGVIGCKSAEDYAHNNGATARWLTTHSGPAAINIAGQWHSEEWGDATLKQEGSRITGILGDYPVGGVLNGRTLYLAITDDAWTEYTAVLTAPAPGVLAGNYSETVPFAAAESSPIRLVRAPR